MKKESFVATTLGGLEEVLAGELKEIGIKNTRAARRSVYFEGDISDMYRANFRLRTALRVLLTLDSFNIRTADDLYRRAKSIPWEDYFDLRKTFAVQGAIYSDIFRNTMFASLRLKDAIVDRFREKFGVRPSINPQNPDVLVNLHISNNLCTVSLDSSGESLHKRGYRVGQNEAPISEVLAAGLIKLSGWNCKDDFIDPMCGSGTIVIEAAMMANQIFPGTIREEYSFKNWRNYHNDIWNEIKGEVTPVQNIIRVSGSDISRRNINIAWKNAEAAKIEKYIDYRISDFKLLSIESDNPFLLFNPPYGERLSIDESNHLYSMIGDRLKNNYTNAVAWIISTNACFKSLGLRPSVKIPIMNGSIECSFRKYELYDGSKKTKDYLEK